MGTGEPPRAGDPSGQHRPETLPPYKFDPTIGDRIVTWLQAGSFVETAAAAAGISKQTFYNWLARGARAEAEREEPSLWAWARRIDQAQAEAELGLLGMVLGAAKSGAWQAAAWYLERKFPERWRRRETVEHTGPGGGPVTTEEVTRLMTSGEKRARLAELLRRHQQAEAEAAARDQAGEEAEDTKDASGDGRER